MIEIFQIAPHIVEVQWPKEISTEILYQKAHVKKKLIEHYPHTLLRAVSGFHNLGLFFAEPQNSKEILTISRNILSNYAGESKMEKHLWKIPVCYNGKDLEKLSEWKNLSIIEIIRLHSSVSYHIHFYGFLPGFLYLGGLDEKLATARKTNPEREIKAGSVAIGGRQTGIYPSTSPGGWHVIGQTPITMFDPTRSPAVWGNEGDIIEFFPIEFNEMALYEGKIPEKIKYA
ncbi:allophanate hydrolase subunit 1 [Litoribacter ruber]|uniref:5-oxoprolinase subunit B family protein n=1 Tax=Litoribacter ruber TaxID=702568 RepID=UPI001BD97A41|nr:allophanate hydrolase subunit 1 [Litoribacter ruber]MBT0810422.1 allophanate hydrolase subunit 1 [Litoribacter ruber]